MFKYLFLSWYVLMSTTKGGEETTEITKSIVIDASPELVFKNITDPKELTSWFAHHAVMEPTEGGKMKLSFYKDSSS